MSGQDGIVNNNFLSVIQNSKKLNTCVRKVELFLLSALSLELLTLLYQYHLVGLHVSICLDGYHINTGRIFAKVECFLHTA